MYKEAFHEKLKKARKESGFTQREVSIETGIAQSNIAKYELGKLEPNIETLGILADFYEVDVNWLLGTKGRASNDNYQHLNKRKGEKNGL